MNRAAALTLLLLGVLTAPGLFLAVRCRGEAGRTHEAVLKDAAFCVQRVTRRAAEADDFDSCLQVKDALRAEARRLRELRAEFDALPPPSRWERSRLRKHRQLVQTTLEAWDDAREAFRKRVDDGLPPHIRLELSAALDDFEAARANAWSMMTDGWD